MAAAGYGLTGPERDIALDEMRHDGSREIDNEARTAGKRTGVDAPGCEEISRKEGFDLLDRVAPVYQGAGSHSAQGVPTNLSVGVHRVGQARWNVRVLSLAGRFTQHRPIGTDHPDPIDGEPLVPRCIR